MNNLKRVILAAAAVASLVSAIPAAAQASTSSAVVRVPTVTVLPAKSYWDEECDVECRLQTAKAICNRDIQLGGGKDIDKAHENLRTMSWQEFMRRMTTVCGLGSAASAAPPPAGPAPDVDPEVDDDPPPAPVKVAGYAGGAPAYVGAPRSRGRAACKPGYKWMNVAGSMVCNKHFELSGGHPKYDQRVKRCQPGEVRYLTRPGPHGTTLRIKQHCSANFSQESNQR